MPDWITNAALIAGIVGAIAAWLGTYYAWRAHRRAKAAKAPQPLRDTTNIAVGGERIRQAGAEGARTTNVAENASDVDQSG